MVVLPRGIFYGIILNDRGLKQWVGRSIFLVVLWCVWAVK